MAITLPTPPTTLATLHRVVLGEAVTREEEEEVREVLHLLGIHTNMLKIKHREVEKNQTEDQNRGPMKLETGKQDQETAFEPKVENFNTFDQKIPYMIPTMLDELAKGEDSTQNKIRVDSKIEDDGSRNKSILFKCESCENTFSTRGNLKTHMQAQHSPDSRASRFQCTKCVAAFKTLLRLQKHCIRNHDGSLENETIKKLTKQDQQKKKAEYKRIKMEKELAEGPGQCEICSSMFETGQKLRIHQRENHEKTFKCPMCIYKFVGQKELDSHFLKRHTDLRKVECKVCGGLYNSEHGLTEHFKRKHTDRDMKICNICGDVFKDLTNHLKRTACGLGKKMEASFKCDLCSKTFTFKHGLKRHIQVIHEQVKDHDCKECDYKTSSKYNLELHQGSVHNGMRPTKQQCPFCDKTPYKLAWHISTYHSLA